MDQRHSNSYEFTYGKRIVSQLEDLQPSASVNGILPGSSVTVVSVKWFGSEALELTYKEPSGRVGNELLYRHDETRVEVVDHPSPRDCGSPVDLACQHSD